MKRVGFILKVKQELIDEYKLRHELVGCPASKHSFQASKLGNILKAKH
jgi:L-rhamnose mutarotase